MNLVDFFLHRGYSLRHEGGGNYRVLGFGGLIVKGDFWYSHSKGYGGKAARLLEEMGLGDYGKVSSAQEHSSPPRQTLPPILRYGELDQRARHYLSRRGIPMSLLDFLERDGLLKYDGWGYLCFIGYDEEGRVRCVSKRAIHPWIRVQKMEDVGSDKRFSFTIPALRTSAQVILCEGPIDALSIACLEDSKHHKGHFQSQKISTCGAPPSMIIQRLKSLKPKSVVLAFDRDAPGQAMTKRLVWSLKSASIRTIVPPPGVGKDPNDWLRNRLRMF